MEAIRAGHRQEAAALGAPSSPPLSRGLQGAWREWARLGSSEGSGPVTRPLAAPSLLRPGFPGRLRGARGRGRAGEARAGPRQAPPTLLVLGIRRGGMRGEGPTLRGSRGTPPVGGAACRYGQGAVSGHEATNSRAPLPAPGPGLRPPTPGAESPRPWRTAQVTPHGNPEGGRGARKRLAQRPRKLGLEPGGALTCPDPHRLRGCAQGPPAALLRSRC